MSLSSEFYNSRAALSIKREEKAIKLVLAS